MNNIFKSVRGTMNKLSAKLYNVLHSEEGNEIVSQIFMIAVVIVVIVVIFFPQLSKMVTGAFDGAGAQLDKVWNYKG